MLVANPKSGPVVFAGAGETVPVSLKAICKLFHVSVKGLELSNRAQVIPIRLVLCEPDNLSLTQLEE